MVLVVKKEVVRVKTAVVVVVVTRPSITVDLISLVGVVVTIVVWKQVDVDVTHWVRVVVFRPIGQHPGQSVSLSDGKEHAGSSARAKCLSNVNQIQSIAVNRFDIFMLLPRPQIKERPLCFRAHLLSPLLMVTITSQWLTFNPILSQKIGEHLLGPNFNESDIWKGERMINRGLPHHWQRNLFL